MKTVQLSELGALAEDVKKGETIEVLDGDKRIARIVSMPDQTELMKHLDQLAAEGKLHRGTGKLPPDFFTRPRPKFEGSVLDELLKEREESW